MGSGVSGLYAGTRGASQPYALLYHVLPNMKERDIQGGIFDKQFGYKKNPSAELLMNCIKNNTIYYQGKKANGNFTYVINENGQIIFGKRNNPDGSDLRSPHPMLIGGKDPQVQCAGIIDIRNGKIFNMNTNSGHYKPNAKSFEKVEKILNSLDKKIFSKKSKWRK